MRFRRRFCATRALVPRYGRLRRPLGTNGWEPGIVLGQSPLDLAQVLPRMLQRPPETAAGGPQLFATLDLGAAHLWRDLLELGVEKLPEVRKPGDEGARLGALDGLQRVLHTFRLADTGGAEVFRLCVGDVGNDVAEQASIRRLRWELVTWDPTDESDDLLAEPLETAAVNLLVLPGERFEVRREAGSRVAVAEPGALDDVRSDPSCERGVGIDVPAV